MKKIALFLSVFILAQAEPPTVFVIFGASGDLTTRKILPAVEHLIEDQRLPDKFAVVGVGRRGEEEFRKQISFSHRLYYEQLSFEGNYSALRELLDQIDRDFGEKSRRIYFLATQPSHFPLIIEQLASYGLLSSTSRVMIEKPFGRDLQSAIELQKTLSQHLDDSQVYRIDHYLGKEGVHYLTQLRAQGTLEERWNHQFIEKVEITLSEELGIGSRANLWEETGLVRDVVQNHILQLVALVAMENQDQKSESWKAMRPIQKAIKGQYGAGTIQGKPVVGYKEEKGVRESSQAETYFSAKLWIDNERWKGVPFHIRAGKRFASQLTEIVVTFKSGEALHIRIQPNPAIFFEGKENFLFEPFAFSEAYQKLIYDCIQGDQSSFVQEEEPFAAWRIVAPVLESDGFLWTYPAGTEIR